MKRRARSGLQVVIGLTLLGSLALLVLKTQQGQTEKKRQVQEKGMVFLALVKNDIIRLELERSEQRVILRREPGSDPPRWRMSAPVDAEADALGSEALLSALSLMDFVREVEPSAETDAALYGLSPPRAIVRAISAQGKRFGLRVGKQNAFDRTLYVQREEDSTILLVPGYHEETLLKTAEALRGKDLWPREPSRIRRVLVRSSAFLPLEIALEGGRWRQRKPAAAEVNPDTVEYLLRSLRTLQALSYPPPGVVPLPAYGLEPPRFTLEVEVETATQPMVLSVGQGVLPSNQDRWFCRWLAPPGPLAQIPEDLGGLLSDLPTRLRPVAGDKP